MLSETLKEETKNLHVALEKAIVPMIKNIREKKDYVKVLELFYSYFGALERKVEAISGLDIPDFHQRRKKEAIADDILSVDGAVPDLAPDQYLPSMENHLQAMGALYVMEGSTLGGVYISKMIAQQLDLNDRSSLTFFEGYGKQTEAMWNTFKSRLNERVIAPEEQHVVVQAANDTFKKFKAWIDLQTAA